MAEEEKEKSMATTMRELLRLAGVQYERDVQEAYQRGMKDERQLQEGAQALAAQPVVLPKSMGAVIEGEDEGATFRLVLADPTDDAMAWFQPATGDWYSAQEVINDFENIRVIHKGVWVF